MSLVVSTGIQRGPPQMCYPYCPPLPHPVDTRPSTTITTTTPTGVGAATPVSKRRDAAGVIYGGQGRPMDMDRQRSRCTMPFTCYNCKEEGHLAQDCPHPQVDKVVHLWMMLEDQGLASDQKHELMKGF